MHSLTTLFAHTFFNHVRLQAIITDHNSTQLGHDTTYKSLCRTIIVCRTCHKHPQTMGMQRKQRICHNQNVLQGIPADSSGPPPPTDVFPSAECRSWAGGQKKRAETDYRHLVGQTLFQTDDTPSGRSVRCRHPCCCTDLYNWDQLRDCDWTLGFWEHRLHWARLRDDNASKATKG